MKVYILICDNGDGSSSLHFFKHKEVAQELCDNEEEYYSNEGDPTVIEVQDDFQPPGGFCD